ncbi:DUF4192 domain-containing protein [Corynebacterium lizhenjunii]|uniref:DUF4192 domain-containing protein n=1 Tax=Corynebacterium lizhenjunii TaxID=2709394 RepID=A0A7T0KCN6_9CORY|nr:DUF4192 domain-containing protein [Corynebacterium lizhenjunii]QPK78335.1 DUF4192 domain-containing protein [Corynebacterium lizhenjunii]
MNTHDTYSPGFLLSNVPGALGFYPTESVLLMAFHEHADNLRLGPIARCDIADAHDYLPEAFDAVSAGTDVVFAFIVSHRPQQSLQWLVDFLYDFRSDDDGREIDACWHSPEIAVGQPYEVCFGPQQFAGGAQDPWCEGTIPSIINSPSMQRWVEQGQLPEVSRAAAQSFYQERNRFLCPSHRAELESIVGREASLLSLGRCLPPSYPPHDLCRELEVEDIPAFIELVVTRATEADWTLDELLRQPGLLGRVGAIMGCTLTRDLAMGALLEAPDAAATILLAVAQSVEGLSRWNALTIFAATQIAQGLPMIAGTVLSVVLKEEPQHTLARLMDKGYRAGLHDSLVDSLRDGSRLAVVNLAEEPESPLGNCG